MTACTVNKTIRTRDSVRFGESCLQTHADVSHSYFTICKHETIVRKATSTKQAAVPVYTANIVMAHNLIDYKIFKLSY